MTTADNTAQQPSGAARDGLLARHPLVFFFLIAYAGSWLLEVPIALSETGTGLLPFTIPRPLLALAIAAATFLGPTLSAFIMTGITEGRIGIRRLLRRYVLWRVGFRWYLFVLLVIPAIEVLGAIVVPGALASFQSLTLSLVLTYPVAFVSRSSSEDHWAKSPAGAVLHYPACSRCMVLWSEASSWGYCGPCGTYPCFGVGFGHRPPFPTSLRLS
jgi:CAAX protease family protein